jgi:hypothetical protein
MAAALRLPDRVQQGVQLRMMRRAHLHRAGARVGGVYVVAVNRASARAGGVPEEELNRAVCAWKGPPRGGVV